MHFAEEYLWEHELNPLSLSPLYDLLTRLAFYLHDDYMFFLFQAHIISTILTSYPLYSHHIHHTHLTISPLFRPFILLLILNFLSEKAYLFPNLSLLSTKIFHPHHFLYSNHFLLQESCTVWFDTLLLW